MTLGALADCSPSFTCPFYGTLFSKENKIIKKDKQGRSEKMRTLMEKMRTPDGSHLPSGEGLKSPRLVYIPI